MSHDAEREQRSPSQRELQHQAVADLGQLALQERSLDELLDRAVAALSRCLGLRFVKVLELSPDRLHLTMPAGTGWQAGVVGTATVPGDAGSQAGFTLLNEDTVVVHDFRTETRFDP